MEGSSSNKRQAESPRGGDYNAKRQNVTMGLEALECFVCSEPLKPPIYQCSLGHFICVSCCSENRDRKCHVCSVETSFDRCFGMEHVVKSVTVPCNNAKYGCAEQVTYYQKEEHEKACLNAPCFCPESGCGFAGPAKMLLDHLTSQHKCPLTALPDSDTASLRLQPGLNVVRRTETSYFFLLSLASEPFGHAITVVCVQPSVTKPKFTCNMNYDCTKTSYRERTSCDIRSSSLFDGLPTGYDLILPKGKILDDREGIMLTTTIHQPLSLSRSCLRGKDPTPALETDGKDNVPLSVNTSHLRGKGPAPRVQIELTFVSDNDEDEDEDEDKNEDEDEDEEGGLALPVHAKGLAWTGRCFTWLSPFWFHDKYVNSLYGLKFLQHIRGSVRLSSLTAWI